MKLLASIPELKDISDNRNCSSFNVGGKTLCDG